MSKNLKDLIKNSQPGPTESTIRQASKSPSKESIVWIVAEADDDAGLYGRMYDDFFVYALPSTDAGGHKSCKNVEEIVQNILSDCSIKIIGIRDKDYTSFIRYSKPANIFLTDRRDIEMMIIESKQGKITPFVNPNSLSDVFSYAKQIGYYRIFNDQENLGFCFDDIDADDYWDFPNKCLKAGWRTVLESFFFNHITSTLHVTQLKQKYNTLATRLNAGNYSDYDICQGHEVVYLLKRTGTNDLNKLDKDLFGWYTKTDYSSTCLANEIKNWAQRNSCRM